MHILETRGLSKNFGGLRAVDDLSLQVKQNSITALIGPNGAGKTTVFNLLTGFLRPSAGGVRFREKDLVGPRPDQIAQMGIARTFQLIRVFRRLTVLENVMLGCKSPKGDSVHGALLKGFGVRTEEKENREKALELLEMVGLSQYKEKHAMNLGYGQQKLVEIARALATDAELILLDEPTAGLSTDMIAFMKDLMRNLRQRGKTIFFIEHNMKVVMDVSEKVYVINFGKKIAEGPPDSIRNSEEVIEAYLGREA